MSTPNINLSKTETVKKPVSIVSNSDRLKEMENALNKVFTHLDMPNGDFVSFGVSDVFDEIIEYVGVYDRVLYSTISNIIFAHYNESERESSDTSDPAGTLLSNLDALFCYSERSEIIAERKKGQTRFQQKNIEAARKVVLKIRDHANLASQQYLILKDSDAEYDEKFRKRISGIKEEMTKEMNAQMITMVGIFTALAFLIFGSISSLDGIFENIEFPLFKVISIGLVWGLCVSNMIFVFLYCIGKMTGLNFKANQSPDASFYQRYPVVCWTDFILVSLLAVSSWGWFIQHTNIEQEIIDYTNREPKCVFIIGSAAIAVLIIAGCFICWAITRIKKSNKKIQ